MRQYVNETLRRAAKISANLGRSDISFMLRQMEVGCSTQLSPTFKDDRVDAIVDRLFDADTLSELQTLLSGVAQAFDCIHCTVAVVSNKEKILSERMHLSTMCCEESEKIVFSLRSSLTLFPTLSDGLEGPIFWNDRFNQLDSSMRHMKEQVLGSVAKSVITQVVKRPGQTDFAITLHSSQGQREFRVVMVEKMTDFVSLSAYLALIFHEIIGSISYIESPSNF